MSDLLDKATIDPAEIMDEEFKLEIIDEPVEGTKDAATLAMEVKLAEMEAQNAAYAEQLTKLQGTGKETDIASALAAELKKIQTPQVTSAPPVKEEIDYNKLFETVDKNFYTSPSKGVVDVVVPLMEQMDKKYSGALSTQAITISKLTMLGDPSGQMDYVKYKEEVDKLVKDSPPSEQVYSNALKMVRANHFEEIMAEKVALQLKEITDKAEAAVTAPPAGVAPGFTNATQVQAAHAKKNAGRITAGQLATASKWAMQKGYDWNDPEDQEWVVKFLKSEGAI